MFTKLPSMTYKFKCLTHKILRSQPSTQHLPMLQMSPSHFARQSQRYDTGEMSLHLPPF